MVVGHRVSWVLGLVCLLAAAAEPALGQALENFSGFSPGKKRPTPKTTFDARLKPANAKPGEEVTLEITATIPKGYHIFSMVQRTGSAPTRVKIGRIVGLDEVDQTFAADKEPHLVPNIDPKDPDLEEYQDSVTWTRKYRLAGEGSPAEALLEGEISYSMCTDPGGDEPGTCIPGKTSFLARLAAEEALPPTPAPSKDSEEQGSVKPEPPPEAAPPAKAPKKPVAKPEYQHRAGGNVVATWKATVSPKQAAPGEIVTLTVEAHVQPGWHLYSAAQKQGPNGEGPQPMAVKFEAGTLDPRTAAFQGPKPRERPSVVDDWRQLNITEQFHEGKVRWTREFEVPKTAKPGDIPVSGVVSYQTCTDTNCVSHAVQFVGKLRVGDRVVDEAVPLLASAIKLGEASERTEEPDPVQDGDQPSEPRAAAAAGPGLPPDIRAGGLFVFLTTAVAFGFLALLTPCVFPMVPITVSVFHKQAERQHTNAILMAAVYALSIIGTFTVLGLGLSAAFGATAVNTLANNPWLNLAIAALLVFFACNMLGMYDIAMPSWILNLTAGQQSRGGYLGVIFMGLTFTLTSFTCTFAFVGGLLAFAAAGEWFWAVTGMVAFSSAFALPFFLLALFPGLLRKLPKSGGWMNTVKVVMGLLELGAVFKFLSVADVMWNGRPAIFDFELVVSAWMVLAAVTGLYLLGLFRTPHDLAVDHVSVPRLILAMSFLGLGGYMAVGLFAAEKAKGVLWENIQAFAPPKIDEVELDAELGPTLAENGLKYALDPDKALAYAILHKKPLFVDITGVNCQNCRLMERGPLSQPAITARLKDFVLVRLYVDRVPHVADFQEARRLVKRNLELQEGWFRDTSLPSYAVVAPTRDAFEKREHILTQFIGFNPDAQIFSQFLDQGLKQLKAIERVQVANAKL